MKKGEIWLINLNPIRGKEQAGTRPVVIVSGNAMNDHLGLSIVCPITSKIKKFAGGVILQADITTGLDTKSEILTFQIRTVAHNRFIKKIGNITGKDMNKIIENINKIQKY